MPLPVPPPTPLVAELAQRLSTRLADFKSPTTPTFVPPTEPNGLYNALLLPGTLSLVAQPARVLETLLPHLNPGGAVLGWVLGQGSFPQLAAACRQAGFTLPPELPAVQDVGGLLQSLKLALPVVDRDIITLTFPSFARMLHHLKAHGALQRPQDAGLVTPQRLKALEDAFPRLPDGRLALTLEVIFFHALKPEPSLPKAAPRGSGKVPMVKILSS